MSFISFYLFGVSSIRGSTVVGEERERESERLVCVVKGERESCL